MPVPFSDQQWEAFRGAHRDWWSGGLKRPLIPVMIAGNDPGRPEPTTPSLRQANCNDFSMTPEQIIDRADWDLSCYTYHGDSYPIFDTHHFGPGLIAAFMGCELNNTSGLVWFHPEKHWDIEELSFTFNEDNPWFQRIADIYRAGVDRWEGRVLIGMNDLGGNLDILSSFLPGDKLLFALHDQPGEVERLSWEAHEAWHAYFSALNGILQPANPGYTSWARVYCEEPTYMLQCDFSYMIGPEMFGRFVLPELEATCSRLTRSMYHLDGVGQLPHLDQLLSADQLDGIQWVPGTGKPDPGNWPDLFRKIRAAGKKYQVYPGNLDTLRVMREQLGDLTGALLNYQVVERDQKDEILMRLEEFGC